MMYFIPFSVSTCTHHQRNCIYVAYMQPSTSWIPPTNWEDCWKMSLWCLLFWSYFTLTISSCATTWELGWACTPLQVGVQNMQGYIALCKHATKYISPAMCYVATQCTQVLHFLSIPVNFHIDMNSKTVQEAIQEYQRLEQARSIWTSGLISMWNTLLMPSGWIGKAPLF